MKQSLRRVISLIQYNYLQYMLFNKVAQGNRPNRLQSNSNRSTTPQHYKSQKVTRPSQSVSKPPTNNNVPFVPVATLPSITEQLQFEKPYYLGKGNNHEIIRKILNRRKGWKEIASNTDPVYFRWVQNSYSFKFHLLGKDCLCFNHFQYHRELSNKQRLVKNLTNFCQANKMNVFNFLPVSFILDLSTGQEDIALHAFIKFFNRNYPDQSGNRKYQTIILPRNKYIPYLTAQQLNKRSQGNFYCKPFCPKTFFDQQTNSYLWILKPTFLNRGRGVVLFKQLQELQKLIWKYYQGQGLEDFCQKFGHPEQKNYQSSSINYDQQMKTQNDELKSLKVSQKLEQSKQGLMKESINQKKQLNMKKIQSNQKKQTHQTQKTINKSPEQEMMNSVNVANNSKKQIQGRCLSFIIQKYIQKPMIIQGKKYDIRVWVLLTHTLQFYIFEEAYLRFSSQPYSTKDSHLNPFIHLTNNSVQKYCNQFDNQSGNQWPLSAIQKYIYPEHKANSIYKSILNKIRQIICLSIFSVRRKINVNSRKQCFQLFGYDFMVDAQYKVWLIQVNTNPAIEQASPLLKMLLPRMIDDMFKLTVDKIFGCKMKQDQQELVVTGYENDHNMWQLLGDLKQGGNLKNDKRLTFARR